MVKVSSLKFVLGLACISLFLNGCGNIIQIAEGALYPFQQANKADVVPLTPPTGWEETKFSYPAEDGTPVTTEVWYSAAAGPTAPTVVYFHGNGENLESLAKYNFLATALLLKVNFVAIDFPSYGRAVGETNQYDLVTGGAKTIAWAKANFPSSKIYVWGRSLGCSVALLSTIKNQDDIAGLILTSPWTSFYALALDLTSLAKQLPASWIAANAYDSKANAPTVAMPVLIEHGTKDTTIPYKFGVEMSTSFSPNIKVTFVPVPNRQHNDMFQDNLTWSSVYSFIH